jgi:hypothetical protein
MIREQIPGCIRRGIALSVLALTASGAAVRCDAQTVKSARPRLLLTPTLLARLKASAAANSPRWRTLKSSCDSWMSSTSPYEVSIGNYSLAYQITGNPAYAAKAISIMEANVAKGLAAISYDAGYGTRTVLPAMAIGYDWCYDRMTAAQRTRFRTQMETWADWTWPETNPARATAWGVRLVGNNYYHGFMSTWLIGLALSGDSAKAAGYINAAKNRWHTEVRPYLDRYAEGGYLLEGTNYGTGSMFRIYQYLAAHLTATGEDLLNVGGFTWPRQAVIAKLYLTAPSMNRNYPGGDQSRSSSALMGDADRAGIMAALAYVNLDSTTAGYGRWWLDRIKPNPIQSRADKWMEFLWYPESTTPVDYTRSLPTGYLAGGSGFMTSRSDWGPDATYVTMQCGPTREDHQDLAQNGFLIYRKEWMAACARLKSSSGLYQTTPFHNAITIGDLQQPRPRVELPRDAHKVVRFADTERYAYFEGEAKDAYTFYKWPRTYPVLNGFRRCLMYLKPGRVVVMDRVDAINAAQVKKWHLNVIAEPTQGPGGDWRTTIAGSRLFLQPLLPAGATIAKVPLNLGSGGRLSSWRLDCAARVGRNVDTFLNVIEVGPDTVADPAKATLLATDRATLVGTEIGGQAVLFDQAPTGTASYRSTAREHFLLGQTARRSYRVTVTPAGAAARTQTVTATDQGVVTFTSVGGTQSIAVAGL